jgi:hypothetical protein
MEIELLTLFGLQTIGIATFSRFETGRPWWQMLLKWPVTLLLTWLVFKNYGHVGTMIFIPFVFLLSLTFHFIWCFRHGIHPIKATPRKKYYNLRGWHWED